MTAPTWRCPQCGSVFPGHACALLPDWIALTVTRGRRRGLTLNLPGGAVMGHITAADGGTPAPTAAGPTGSTNPQPADASPPQILPPALRGGASKGRPAGALP